MSTGPDPKIIAKALKFLASGFEMAGDAGVPGLLRRVDEGPGDSPYGGRQPKQVRVICNTGRLEFDLFSVRVPPDFLLDSISEGRGRTSVVDQPGRVDRCGGMAARDGSESYDFQRVDLSYAETGPDGFVMDVKMRLGQPVAHTFICTAAVDRSHEIYQITFEVEFRDIFRFLFPVTKEYAEAAIARIDERSGIRVERPPFFVSK